MGAKLLLVVSPTGNWVRGLDEEGTAPPSVASFLGSSSQPCHTGTHPTHKRILDEEPWSSYGARPSVAVLEGCGSPIGVSRFRSFEGLVNAFQGEV